MALLDKFRRILWYMRHGGSWQSFVFSCFGALRDLALLLLPLCIPDNLRIAPIYIASFFYCNAAFFIDAFLNQFFFFTYEYPF
jgi:hypothetical protein